MTSRIFALVLAFACLPVAAFAQSAPLSMAPAEECFALGGWEDCIGLSAEACMEEGPGDFGYTVESMVICQRAELDYWAGEYEQLFLQMHELARAEDVPGEDQANLTELLREMRAAWEAWRDARCAYESFDPRGSLGAKRIDVACRLGLTGREVLRLRADLAAG